MYWAEFFTVALIHLLAVASPGPDFAIVVRESVAHGRRAGTWTALGVGTGIFVHVAYSLLGIGLIVSQSIVLFNALKWAAAAYLLYIGFKALRAQPAKTVTDDLHRETGVRTARGAFTSGFVTNGLNPKATLFFLAVFTQVLQINSGLGEKLWYAGIIFGLSAVWWPVLVFLIQSGPVRRGLEKTQKVVDKLLGGMLIALGIKVALS